MAITAKELVSEALATWIIADLGRHNDFAREGLPDCSIRRLLASLSSSASFKANEFSLALVGFDLSEDELQAAAQKAGLKDLAGTTTDLHIATEWRNNRASHVRIIAFARGYNPSVHGLSFFGRATSSELATHLIKWAKDQSTFTATPQHRALLDALLSHSGLQPLRSLEGMASFLESWSLSKTGSINGPRDALPKLGLLPDPRLFEASDLAKQLELNLQLRELITIMAPGEVRQRRKRAEKFSPGPRRKALLQSLGKLDAFRRGEAGSSLAFEDAELIIRPPSEVITEPDPIEGITDNSDQDKPQPDIMHEAVDALLDGRQEDLDSIGLALEAAWEEFEINGDRIAATAQTTRGTVSIDLPVDAKLLDWVTAFCSADRFGGLLETEVVDLRQALDRYAESDPTFIDPTEIWKHNGMTRSIEQLLEGWDSVDAVREGQSRPLVETWKDLIERRSALAEDVRQLLIHPREWLDTHVLARQNCKDYIAVASELYGGIQRHYQEVWDKSRDWAQATLDAILSIDIVQVRIRSGTKISAKAVMLPLHPLHLWRYQRLGEVLRDFTQVTPLSEADRQALIEELQRPEQFLSVIRTGATPSGRGLNQLLPVSNDIQGLATFENLHNAVSSADGIDTLVQALDHYVSLYPNHPRPLRLALINPPEPAKLLEQIVKLLSERRHTDRLLGISIDMFATAGHRDRLAAASALEGSAQDLVYEKVASGRLELRVAASPAPDITALLNDRFGGRSFHVVALFDESAISIRRRRLERLLRMSPFCVRNEIVVDDLLGDISLSPHPGEPPFSDFVLMIQEMEREQRDSTMFASADAETLRATVDKLVLGSQPLAKWVLLADRALPAESGMHSVRLLERREGQRQILLCAADHGRLARLMNSAFQECNLTVPNNLDDVLRQGVNLVGAGLLDMIKKQTGQPDTSKVVGFVGMLLAARDVLLRRPNSLIASVDTRVARLWLRLGPRQTADRCDLLAVSLDPSGHFLISCIEVKTTLDPLLTDEDERIGRAAAQIASTVEVVESALEGEDAFSAPRLEMLKEIFVRAAAARWGTEAKDAERRRIWGPSLKKLFGQSSERPTVRVDGEIVLVKLRSSDDSSHYPLASAARTSIRIITEPLAESLLAGHSDTPIPLSIEKREDKRDTGRSKLPSSLPTKVVELGASAQPLVDAVVVSKDAPSNLTLDHPASRKPQPGGPESTPSSDGLSLPEHDTWPPAVNALGMVGQFEVARELADLARKAKGWGERFPDKLLVGPAGVGKSSLARRLSEQLLGLEPILFNGADLRRPEMIIERLAELKKVPARARGTVEVDACLIFIDEVHAIHGTVATALLSALDDRRTTTVGNVIYSFNQVVFLLATTDPGRLTEAFLSRPTKTTLRSYTLDEMAGIVWLHGRDTLEGASLSRETCIEVAARMQCNPRPSVNILGPLVAYFYGIVEAKLGGVPSRADVASCMTVEAVGSWFSETLAIDSNGLGSLHMDYLKILKSRGAAPEDEIRRTLGISNRGDFIEVSEYLTRLGLVQVGPGGRSLTADGRRYLTSPSVPDLRSRISRRGG